MRKSRAMAAWEGKLKDGKGTFRAGTGAFSGPYTFGTRFGDAPGTNPEELIAAAHAACFSMALAAVLEEQGHTATRVATEAVCTIDVIDGAGQITQIELRTKGQVPGIDQAAYAKAAEAAKENCPVSKALKQGVKISVQAVLE